MDSSRMGMEPAIPEPPSERNKLVLNGHCLPEHARGLRRRFWADSTMNISWNVTRRDWSNTQARVNLRITGIFIVGLRHNRQGAS
jgi:hypothetical protein